MGKVGGKGECWGGGGGGKGGWVCRWNGGSDEGSKWGFLGLAGGSCTGEMVWGAGGGVVGGWGCVSGDEVNYPHIIAKRSGTSSVHECSRFTATYHKSMLARFHMHVHGLSLRIVWDCKCPALCVCYQACTRCCWPHLSTLAPQAYAVGMCKQGRTSPSPFLTPLPQHWHFMHSEIGHIRGEARG